MNEIVGQEKVLEYLRGEFCEDAYTHAYLFYGPQNIGKTEVAKVFSRSFFCENKTFGGCSNCSSCKLILSGNHPDLNIYDNLENMSVKEVREIIKNLDLKAHQSKNRVFILPNIERFSTSALNSFLKSLEEPSPGNIIILTSSNLENVLDTIKSRARQVKFTTVDNTKIFEHLNKNLLIKRDDAEKLVKYSGGRPGLAITLAGDPTLFEKYIKVSNDMWQTYKNNSIYDKIAFTDSIIKNDDLVQILEFSQIFGQNNLYDLVNNKKESECLVAASYISSLENAISLINRNINKKIVFDNLMLGNLNG
jgi:DNA polymerase III delta' subunit